METLVYSRARSRYRLPHFTAERLPLGEDRYRVTLVQEAYNQGPETPAHKEQREQDIHVFAHFVRTGELACAHEGVSKCVSAQESEWGGYVPWHPGFPPGTSPRPFGAFP